jgi:hypothetical protein
MAICISREDLDGGGHIDYDPEYATLEDAVAVVVRSLTELGVATSTAFAIEDGGEEQLVFQFEPQGDNGLKTRRDKISAVGGPDHWAEDWLAQ